MAEGPAGGDAPTDAVGSPTWRAVNAAATAAKNGAGAGDRVELSARYSRPLRQRGRSAARLLGDCRRARSPSAIVARAGGRAAPAANRLEPASPHSQFDASPSTLDPSSSVIVSRFELFYRESQSPPPTALAAHSRRAAILALRRVAHPPHDAYAATPSPSSTSLNTSPPLPPDPHIPSPPIGQTRIIGAVVRPTTGHAVLRVRFSSTFSLGTCRSRSL